MSDLFEEVKSSFDKCRENQARDNSPVIVFNSGDELAPGFDAMREFYSERILCVIRRGYHHFAGTRWLGSSDDVLERTNPVMLPLLVQICMESFCQGVMITHRDHLLVKMAWHFENLEHLYHTPEFRELSQKMAKGFASDEEVLDFFAKYIAGGVDHVSHITGFAHKMEFDPNKVWDIYNMLGTAVMASGFIAGTILGEVWRERDLLSEMEIALEEN